MASTREEALLREIELLRNVALTDAIEGLEDMIGYVPEYVREKYDTDGFLARARAALGGDLAVLERQRETYERLEAEAKVRVEAVMAKLARGEMP